jgi:hypothetical protein
VRLRIFRINNLGGIVPKDELNEKIKIINKASKELYIHKDVLFKTLIKLNDDIYNYNFINKLKYSDEFAELNVWGSKFKITWDLKAKNDIESKLYEQSFFLLFTIHKISFKKKYEVSVDIDNFTITYDKQILYNNAKDLCLDIDTNILRLFNLIFENYFDKNIQELIVEYPNVEV